MKPFSIKFFISLFLVVAGLAGLSLAQTALSTTTLTNAVNGPPVYNGTSSAPNIDTCVTLASVTGVTAAFNSSVVITVLYMDQEAFGVITVNTTSKVVCGIRGYNTTKASPHAANALVWVIPINTLGQNALFDVDPPIGGACTAASTMTTPWINKFTGQLWVCGSSNTPGGSQITVWQPISGVGNPYTGSATTYYLQASYTNATTTFSSVVGLAFPILANHNYHAICRITWQGSAGTTGPKYQFTGPSSPTAVVVGMNSVVTATTVIAASATAFSSAVANTGTVTSATNFTDTVDLGVINAANAGTVQLQAAANGAGTLTIQPGSSCHVQ